MRTALVFWCIFRKAAMGLVSKALVFTLCLQTVANFAPSTGQSTSKKLSRLKNDQRVAHVLSRLTFGARPGDFERVNAMGVEAFINQQLVPDSIDNSNVMARLRR